MSRVLVVGAGIGGLSAAHALGRDGHEVAVFERRPEVAQIQAGGAIHVWHNGMRGLQRLGLAGDVAALGGEAARVRTAEMRNWRGRLLTRWSVAAVEAEVGAPTLGVRRPELHRVLTGALGTTALQLGRRCTGFVQDADGVTVQFEDGGEERGELLIGADGLRSTVRAGLLGAEPPRFAGYASWQAICAYEGPDAPVGLFRIVWGPGARFLFYHVGPGRLYWEGIFACQEGGHDPPGGRREAVGARFAGWDDPLPAIVAATEEAAITRLDMYDRPPARRWGEGRVTLLGDAAHPMTNAVGQGANVTIEDAVVLGSRIARAANPLAGLRDYERERIGRGARTAQLAWRLSRLSRWRSPLAVAARDPLIAAVMLVGRRAQRRDMAYAF